MHVSDRIAAILNAALLKPRMRARLTGDTPTAPSATDETPRLALCINPLERTVLIGRGAPLLDAKPSWADLALTEMRRLTGRVLS